MNDARFMPFIHEALRGGKESLLALIDEAARKRGHHGNSR